MLKGGWEYHNHYPLEAGGYAYVKLKLDYYFVKPKSIKYKYMSIFIIDFLIQFEVNDLSFLFCGLPNTVFSQKKQRKFVIYRDKTMADKLMFIPNDDTQNSPLL